MTEHVEVDNDKYQKITNTPYSDRSVPKGRQLMTSASTLLSGLFFTLDKRQSNNNTTSEVINVHQKERPFRLDLRGQESNGGKHRLVLAGRYVERRPPLIIS